MPDPIVPMATNPDLVAVMAPIRFGAAGNQGADSSASSKINESLSRQKSLNLSDSEIQSASFQKAISNPNTAPALLRQLDSETLKRIRKSGAVPKVNDSEAGASRAFKDAGIKSRREQVRVLTAVYEFLKGLGRRKADDYQKGKVKVDPAQVAANAAWQAAATAIPGLRIAKSLAVKVIKAILKQLKIWYNNNCGGSAGQRIGDFSDVGGAGRQQGRCQAASGEPSWVDTGFMPYVWKTAVSTSKWSYSPLGFGKDKKEIKALLDARRKRGKGKPPPSKKGGKNTKFIRPFPAVI